MGKDGKRKQSSLWQHEIPEGKEAAAKETKMVATDNPGRLAYVVWIKCKEE